MELNAGWMYLWEDEKIPVLKSSCHHDDWWSTRKRDFWDWRTEVAE